MHRLVAKSVISSSPRLLSFAGSLRTISILGFQVAPLLRPICKKYHHRSVKLSNEVPKITRRLSRMKILDDEANLSHIMWWKEMMRICRKPSSLLLVERLKYTNLLGLDINLRNGSMHGPDNSIPLSPQWLQTKLGGNKEHHTSMCHGEHVDSMKSSTIGEDFHERRKRKDDYKLVLHDTETGSMDRWRDEERETYLAIRRVQR